jgi:hypothetical protein
VWNTIPDSKLPINLQTCSSFWNFVPFNHHFSFLLSHLPSFW